MQSYDPDYLSKDKAFDLMRDEKRRIIVHLLLEYPTEWDVERLAEAVADRISEPLDKTANEHESRILITLVHSHVPQLADSGVITFDSTERTVAPGDPIDDLTPLI